MDDTQLFLVRVWQRQCQFHASVRDIADEAPIAFTRAEDLTAFLVRAAAAAAPSATDPNADPNTEPSADAPRRTR